MRFQCNPILKKELKLGARTVKFPLAVAIYSAIISFVAIMFVLFSSFATYMSGLSETNYQALTGGFTVLSFTQIFIIGTIIPILTAGTIAGERERQTLDILLTAPVSRWSIVVGKLAACMARIFIFIISTLPALSICFLYGGIQWQSLIIFVAESMLVAFFAGAVGVWSSSVFRKTVSAVIITMIITAAFYFVPVIIYASVLSNKEMSINFANSTSSSVIRMGIWGLVLLFSPAIGYYQAITSATSGRTVTDILAMAEVKNAPIVDLIAPYWCWVSAAITIGLGLLFLVWAASNLDAPRRKGKRLNSEPINQEIYQKG